MSESRVCVALSLQVFNDQQTFSEWFTRFLGNDGDGKPAEGGAEASAMDREKRILVVNRLHQILSPFMLRRMVSALLQPTLHALRGG